MEAPNFFLEAPNFREEALQNREEAVYIDEFQRRGIDTAAVFDGKAISFAHPVRYDLPDRSATKETLATSKNKLIAIG